MEIVRPIVQECFVPAQYTSSPEIIKNCLQEVLSEGMMYSQVSAPADNEDMTKKQRENIIKKHMEQKQYEQLENGKWKKHLEVVEHTKSDAGYRTLYVVSSAMELFEKVKDAMKFAGHRDVKTFINHYCFSRYSDEQKRQELEKTLNV